MTRDDRPATPEEMRQFDAYATSPTWDASRQPRFADMSAQQRSASMDNMVRQIEALTAANNKLREDLQAHIASHYKTPYTFRNRFRWLLFGKD